MSPKTTHVRVCRHTRCSLDGVLRVCVCVRVVVCVCVCVCLSVCVNVVYRVTRTPSCDTITLCVAVWCSLWMLCVWECGNVLQHVDIKICMCIHTVTRTPSCDTITVPVAVCCSEWILYVWQNIAVYVYICLCIYI